MKKTSFLLFFLFFNLITFSQEKGDWIWYLCDIEIWFHTEEDEIEIRIANTLAPHYSILLKARDLGPLKSGLIGPVQLKISK